MEEKFNRSHGLYFLLAMPFFCVSNYRVNCVYMKMFHVSVRASRGTAFCLLAGPQIIFPLSCGICTSSFLSVFRFVKNA